MQIFQAFDNKSDAMLVNNVTFVRYIISALETSRLLCKRNERREFNNKGKTEIKKNVNCFDSVPNAYD
jgi:hypothetical protein